jgi:regulatory protein
MEYFCSYQERCLWDVQQKINQFEVSEAWKSKVIDELIDSGFLDDDRYVQSFIRTKTIHKRDGIQKIKNALYQKKISPKLIDQYLKDIEQDAVKENISLLLQKKWSSLILKNTADQCQQKTIRYMLGKGYLYDDFKEELKKISIEFKQT